MPGTEQDLDGVGEADRLAHIAAPVLGVPILCCRRGGGHRGVGGNRGVAGGQRGQRRAQLVEDRVHQPAVVGHLHTQHAGENAVRGELFGDIAQDRRRAREGHRRRAVDRGDVHAVEVGEQLAGLGLGQPDREHRAAAGGGGLQPGAVVADRHRLGESERAGHVRGGDLADAVAHHHRGPDAALGEFRGQGGLQQEVRGLRDLGAGDAGFRLRAQHLVQDRPARELAELPVDLARYRGRRAVAAQQFPAHAPPLRPHAAVDEHRIGTALGHRPRRDLPAARRELGQLGAQIVGVGVAQCHPQRMMCPPHPCRGGETVHGFGVDRQFRGQRPQRRLAARRQGEDRQTGGVAPHDDRVGAARAQRCRGLSGDGAGVGPRWRHRAGIRCGTDDHVRVGAAVTEAVDRDQRPAQRLGRHRHTQPQAVEVDVGIRVVQAHLRGDDAVVDRQRRFDHPGHARRRLGVPDIVLQRAHRQRLGAPGDRAVHVAERRQLDRVADRRARPVCLDESDLLGRDPGLGVDAAREVFLGNGIGHRDGERAAVLVHAAAAHHRVDAVTVA